MGNAVMVAPEWHVRIRDAAGIFALQRGNIYQGEAGAAKVLH